MARGTHGNNTVSLWRLPRLRYPKIPDAMRLLANMLCETERCTLQVVQNKLPNKAENAQPVIPLKHVPTVADERRLKAWPVNNPIPVQRKTLQRNSSTEMKSTRQQVPVIGEKLPELQKKPGDINSTSDFLPDLMHSKFRLPIENLLEKHPVKTPENFRLQQKNLSQRLRLELAR